MTAFKSDCYCNRCEKPVAGQKRTHSARNVGATLALPATLGFSALLYRKGVWHCPICGSSAIRDLDAEAKDAEWQAFLAKHKILKWAVPLSLLTFVMVDSL